MNTWSDEFVDWLTEERTLALASGLSEYADAMRRAREEFVRISQSHTQNQQHKVLSAEQKGV